MSYINENKKAWENAFENRAGDYAKDLIKKLNDEENPFFHQDFLNVINTYDLKHKKIAQFCTNNGRELLQLARLPILQAVGFDIAQNMVDHANQIAKTLNLKAIFHQRNILEIEDTFHDLFDFGLITIGALCWFKDLDLFFDKVSKTLKKGATLLIHEAHPLSNMLVVDGEEGFDQKDPKKIVNNYFEGKIWEEHGMGYMTDGVPIEQTFTSFSHQLSDILNALIHHGFQVTSLLEYDYCIGNMFDHISHQGVPLSMIMTATKMKD